MTGSSRVEYWSSLEFPNQQFSFYTTQIAKKFAFLEFLCPQYDSNSILFIIQDTNRLLL